MKIIVTGGSGFIGSSIVDNLSKNHEVKIFDFKKPKNLNNEFLQGDIKNLEEVVNSIKDCDVVIHLAATLGVIHTEKNPVLTLDTNTGGTKNVLEACRINKIKKIIFTSSSEVYGEPIKIPIKETDKVIPITNYGISKLAAEEYIKAYSKKFGIKFTILRLFNVNGEEQQNQWVMSEFVGRAIKNQDVIIHGTGSQVRAFCHVSDAVRCFEIVLEKGDNETFNVGNDTEPISIKELAAILIKKLNSKIKIIFENINKFFVLKNENNKTIHIPIDMKIKCFKKN